MAKKKKEETPAPAPAQLVPVMLPPQPMSGVRSLIDMQLTKDEVIDAMVETERSRLEDELEVVTKALTDHDKVVLEFAQKETEKIQKVLSKKLAPLVRALTDLTGIKHSLRWGNQWLNSPRQGAYVEVVHNYPGYNGAESAARVYGHSFKPEDLADLIPAGYYEEMGKKRQKLDEHRQTLNVELAKLQKKGRRARSALVIELLKGSDDGRRMLAAAQGNEKRKERRAKARKATKAEVIDVDAE